MESLWVLQLYHLSMTLVISALAPTFIVAFFMLFQNHQLTHLSPSSDWRFLTLKITGV